MAKKTTKKSVKKITKQSSQNTEIRRVKNSNYKSFKLNKRIKADRKQLTGAPKLFINSLVTIKQNWRLFLVITAIYGLASIILVRGVGGGLNLSAIKDSIRSGINGQFAEFTTGAVLFGYLLGSMGASASPAGGAYQTLLVIIMSLVVIWALRQVIAGHSIRARDAFYNGTYPLIQFVLVLIIISLQLLPLAIGGWLYTAVVSSGIAATGLAKSVWLLLFVSLAILSIYMVASSIFALYIVTLPNMTPLKALRSARALVLHRRWLIIRKVLFLPLAIIVVGALIMIPLILLITPIAQWVFFGLSMLVLVVVHSYMYSLYRELL